MVKKNLFHAFDHGLQCLNVIFERFLACLGDGIRSVGFSPHKTFVHFQKTTFFQSLQVRSQVAVGDFQQLFQVVERNLVVHHQAAHDAKPYPVVEGFVQACYGIVYGHSLLRNSRGITFIFPPHDKTINDMQHAETKGPEKQAFVKVLRGNKPKDDF